MKIPVRTLPKRRYFVYVVGITVLLCIAPYVIAQPKPSEAELAAVTTRGRMLAAYDTAAWQATDAVTATHAKAEPSGRYIAHLTEAGWVVDFGNLNAAGDKFVVIYEATQVAGPAHFDVKTFELARQDGGWNLSAAIGIETATRDFGHTVRPYNISVLPRTSGGLYVYLYPAQVKAGVYPLGADVRYRLSPDGSKVIEKRQMHKTILEFAPPTDPSESIAGGYHTHVLSDLPEDTDVMLVLTRQPRVPETVGAGAYVFTVAVDGTITVADRPGAPGNQGAPSIRVKVGCLTRFGCPTSLRHAMSGRANLNPNRLGLK